MAKLTTEEFIARAKEVHGDTYDYSKVEYVNSTTKVCIICKKHGEFWQRPIKHLKGQKCAKCSFDETAEKRRIWTYEKCYKIAQQCHSKKDMEELNVSAYEAAYKKGWVKDYTWFKKLWEPKWNKETCHREAKKYKSRSEFRIKCPNGYISAWKHGWLDDYKWFAPPRQKVPTGYWTYERCYEEAQKYKTLAEFAKNANGAKQFAEKKSWIKDYTWFIPPFVWTRELCEKEARKYTTKKDFYVNGKKAYTAAVRKGWLQDFYWLNIAKQPNGFWTKEKCEAESRKYESKKEFLKGCPAAHAAAAKNGWLNDFIWLVDKRVDIIKDKIDSVYVYVFEETKAAYVGRTLMRRQNKRDKEHIFNVDSDNVARYAKKHNVSVPPMKILESDLTIEEGLDREDYWRKWYEEHGYKMLNHLATGIGKGSLGRISQGKWNRKACYAIALKCKSASEFEKINGSAYAAARRNGWLEDYTWFDVLWEPKWDKESCYKEAKKYKSRKEFKDAAVAAYAKAIRMKWIDEYDWMPSRQYKPAGYWNDYDHCLEEAKKYSNRLGFQKGCTGAYNKALKNGWLDDYIWFKEMKKPNGYWNQETCYEEAKKYSSKKEFKQHANGAYQTAYAKGWLDDYTWFKQLTSIWTYETCKAEASKYEKRSHFKKGCPGAHAKSRMKGWLDEFFPKKQ